MVFINFKMRMKIESLFIEWCEKNGITKEPNSMVAFMIEEGWLNEEKINKDLHNKALEYYEDKRRSNDRKVIFMNHCSIENKLCSIATKEGKCPISACIKKNETIHAVYKEGKKVWPPEDPVDIHDEISKGFARIEKVMREESARISEIIREAVVQKDTYVYKPTASTIYWPNTYIPEACRSCTNHPSNGGTGICHCTLGSPSVTCSSTDCSWK